MPKRTQAPALADLRLEKVECLVTGRKAQPIPIPQIQECGMTCVPINSTDHWLTQIASGRCRGDASLVVKEFVDEVLSVLAAAADGGGETRGRPLVAAEGAGGSPPNPKGRAAMGLDDDSDEAELALVPSAPPKKARKNVVKEHRTISCGWSS